MKKITPKTYQHYSCISKGSRLTSDGIKNNLMAKKPAGIFKSMPTKNLYVSLHVYNIFKVVCLDRILICYQVNR